MLKQVLEIIEFLDRPEVAAADVARLFAAPRIPEVEIQPVRTEQGSTLFIKLLIPGSQGGTIGESAPTLGIIGYLGGVRAKPEVIGLVSDADACVAALAAGLKLVQMHTHGDRLPGDVIVTTHISTDALIVDHAPVPFMTSPVDMATKNRYVVDQSMEAILSLDTTRGNRIVNSRGFAISPTVKEGYILRVSEDLLTIQQNVTGRLPSVFAITTQDITPYGNGVFHLNSIMQPATCTDAPVVGVAITSEIAVAGSASGASQECDIEMAARFAVEVAKAFDKAQAKFYDPEEFTRMTALYGSMKHLQRAPKLTNGSTSE
jgi:hypothetical protein